LKSCICFFCKKIFKIRNFKKQIYKNDKKNEFNEFNEFKEETNIELEDKKIDKNNEVDLENKSYYETNYEFEQILTNNENLKEFLLKDSKN
jgi:hypothetical protein